jgi:putative ABC transport system permease protein
MGRLRLGDCFLSRRPRDVLLLVLRQGTRFALPGLLAGMVAAVGLARVASAALVAVSPADPAVYAAAAMFTVVIAVIATAFPAWRAVRVDPLLALRHE